MIFLGYSTLACTMVSFHALPSWELNVAAGIVFCGCQLVRTYTVNVIFCKLFAGIPANWQYWCDCAQRWAYQILRSKVKYDRIWPNRCLYHSYIASDWAVMSSSYRSNRLGLSHCDPYAVRRGGCLELYRVLTWWSGSGGIQAWSLTTNWFP